MTTSKTPSPGRKAEAPSVHLLLGGNRIPCGRGGAVSSTATPTDVTCKLCRRTAAWAQAKLSDVELSSAPEQSDDGPRSDRSYAQPAESLLGFDQHGVPVCDHGAPRGTNCERCTDDDRRMLQVPVPMECGHCGWRGFTPGRVPACPSCEHPFPSDEAEEHGRVPTGAQEPSGDGPASWPPVPGTLPAQLTYAARALAAMEASLRLAVDDIQGRALLPVALDGLAELLAALEVASAHARSRLVAWALSVTAQMRQGVL